MPSFERKKIVGQDRIMVGDETSEVIRKEIDLKSLLQQKRDHLSEANSTFERRIASETQKKNNTFQQTQLQGAEWKSEDYEKSIQNMQESIAVNTIKQEWLHAASDASLEELKTQLTQIQEAAAKDVQEAYQENIRQGNTPENQKKLAAKQMRLRAFSELWDEMNQT